MSPLLGPSGEGRPPATARTMSSAAFTPSAVGPLTRTALQRKAELNDVDVNNDDRICLTEYYLLHYKIMILKENL